MVLAGCLINETIDNSLLAMSRKSQKIIHSSITLYFKMAAVGIRYSSKSIGINGRKPDLGLHIIKNAKTIGCI